MNNGEKDDHLLLFGAVFVVLFLLIPAWYAAHSGAVNGPLLILAKAQIKIFAAFSNEAAEAYRRMNAVDASALGWNTVEKILYYSGSWIRWPYILLLMLLGIASILMGRARKLSRRMDMESLLKNNVQSFPCLNPIVGKGKYLLSQESRDTGPWRIARTPIQFVLENGLLKDAAGEIIDVKEVLPDGLPAPDLDVWGHCSFDEVKALQVIRLQLGKKYEGVDGLSPCRLVMAASFLAYASGDKKSCVAMLDEVSLSYKEANGEPICPALDKLTDNSLELFIKHQSILAEKYLLRHAAYELPWFMALLYRARKKGVLATSQFLWLRPLDRPLWYALNQCGGRAAWTESVAAWAHYMAEEKAGKAYPMPRVGAAVGSLKHALSGMGWLLEKDDGQDKEKKTGKHQEVLLNNSPQVSGVEPPPELVFYAAEDDPEYDANNDPELANEQF